jgi:hypothetical protein
VYSGISVPFGLGNVQQHLCVVKSGQLVGSREYLLCQSWVLQQLHYPNV